ncbi:hypothetical protein KR100_01375 [Synechococcus sp. KORDI-100]|nr:hypothetical protein KR100_01375 [Synechococcus sp. KORDI-100]
MYIQNNCPSYSLKEDVIEWVEQILQPDYEQINCKLIKRIKNLSHWNDIHTNQIVSPSDVGIHNTLANNHCLYFIDFEYAGLDDLSKFAADWVLQPKYIFNKNEESKLIQYLCKYFYSKIRDSWVERYYDIKPLIALKWCLIMLNSARNGTLTQKQFNMMKSYYQATKRLDN